MAILQSGDLSLEFNYLDYDEHRHLHYEIRFLWRGESMVQDDLLKRESAYWASRSQGAFIAEQRERDTFLPFLARTLNATRPDFWSLVEPDICIAIYPHLHFPLLPGRIAGHERAQEIAPGLTARGATTVPAPDDTFLLLAQADTYQWRESEGYSDNGLALILHTNRAALEGFRDDLQAQWERFCSEHSIEAKLYWQERLEEDANELEG